MPKLSDEEKSQLSDLQRRHAEAEAEAEDAERESKDAEAAKRKAIASGAPKDEIEKKREAAEIARMSESSSQNLAEKMEAMMGLLEEALKDKGVPQDKIEEAKRGRKRMGSR